MFIDTLTGLAPVIALIIFGDHRLSISVTLNYNIKMYFDLK